MDLVTRFRNDWLKERRRRTPKAAILGVIYADAQMLAKKAKRDTVQDNDVLESLVCYKKQLERTMADIKKKVSKKFPKEALDTSLQRYVETLSYITPYLPEELSEEKTVKLVEEVVSSIEAPVVNEVMPIVKQKAEESGYLLNMKQVATVINKVIENRKENSNVNIEENRQPEQDCPTNRS
jgi:hypothetical protein